MNFNPRSLLLLLGITVLGCGASAGASTDTVTDAAGDTYVSKDADTTSVPPTDTNDCNNGDTTNCVDASDAGPDMDSSGGIDSNVPDTTTVDPGSDTSSPPDTTDPELLERLSCQQAFLCVKACGGGESCQIECSEQYPEGAARLDTMLLCVIAVCGDTPGESDPGWAAWIFCTQDAQAPGASCAAETEQCLAGPEDCANIVHCSNQCGSSQSCHDLCHWTGTLLAQSLYQAFRGCVYANCSSICGEEFEIDACTACQTDYCGPKMQACQDN